MDTTHDLLGEVLRRLSPKIVNAVAGHADRFLIWIVVDADEGSCSVSLLTPPTVLDAELDGELPTGTAGRVLSCHPELSLPVVISGAGRFVQAWIIVNHRPSNPHQN
jgi:hypothetical protein